MKTIYRFFIYGLIGIWLEIFWTGLDSFLQHNYTLKATTYIWMIFIYGLGVFLEPIQDIIKNLNIFIRGSIYMILIYLGEYITGNILKLLLGVCPWNYTDVYSINGIITLSFVPLWFIVGILFEKVHKILDNIHIQLEFELPKIRIPNFISKKKQL